MKHYITPSGINNLKKKIAERTERLRAIQSEKAHAYTASGDGWHDNPGWLQLGQQEEQASNEIRELQTKLATATVVTTVSTQVVQLGSLVTYLIRPKNGGEPKELTVEIVGKGEGDPKAKRISYDSPIGAALCHMRGGEEKLVQLPNGLYLITAKSISIAP